MAKRVNDRFDLVFVVRDGQAVQKNLQVGLMNGVVVEVTSGLAVSDHVILAPDSEVRHVTRVGRIGLGKFTEAEVCYRRAIELDPKDAYPHNGLGDL